MTPLCSVSEATIIGIGIGFWILFLYPVWNPSLNQFWGQPAVVWAQVACWSRQVAAEHQSNYRLFSSLPIRIYEHITHNGS